MSPLPLYLKRQVYGAVGLQCHQWLWSLHGQRWSRVTWQGAGVKMEQQQQQQQNTATKGGGYIIIPTKRRWDGHSGTGGVLRFQICVGHLHAAQNGERS